MVASPINIFSVLYLECVVRDKGSLTKGEQAINQFDLPTV